MGFFDELDKRAKAVNSLLCVGLDPHVSELPEATAAAAEQFCVKLIEATHDIALAYKPNSAFFEAFGAEGFAALQRVIAKIPAGIPVVLDSKRGDISTTAAAYATSTFDVLNAHAVTLNPYMGWDAIDPFVGNDENRGCFVLCKTSNPTADQLQSLQVTTKDGKNVKLFEQVAILAEQHNTKNNIGLVVGATDVSSLKSVRKHVANIWILAPGIGAQGGDLEGTVHAGTNANGSGLLIPISRGISKAADPRTAALKFRDAINTAVKSKTIAASAQSSSVTAYKKEFIAFALECSVLKFGDFTLKSGRKSPYFFNAGLFSTGDALARLGRYYAEAIVQSKIEFDVLFGPAYKGIPLVAAVSIALATLFGRNVPYAYNRKEAKDHGEGGILVGAAVRSKRVLLIDDVITAGTAIRESITVLQSEGAVVSGTVIAIDRMEKGPGPEGLSAIQEVEKTFGFPVVSVVSLNDLVSYLESSGKYDAEMLNKIKEYRKQYGISI